MDLLNSFPLLFPAGSVGVAERELMLHAVLFMLIVAVPVYFIAFFFAYRYRDRGASARANIKGGGAAYMPDWEHGKMEELIWWAIPFEIVLILGALTWSSTHQLDPTRPLEGGPPLIVEVVALEWKWLFIYPQEGVASVNYLAMPVNTPVEFHVTAQAPMNSFWIPQLGGQIYAMTGMSTMLHLIANKEGVYDGYSANYSGVGFADMHFAAEAMPQENFGAWLAWAKESPTTLSYAAYKTLAQPNVPEKPTQYGDVEKDLYNTIVMQFMQSGKGETPAKAFPHVPQAAAGVSPLP